MDAPIVKAKNVTKIIITTPENVALEMEMASVSHRCSAFMVDLFLLALLSLLVILFANLLATVLNPMLVAAFIFIALFFLWNGYFIWFELHFGATPGKKAQHFRVIQEDGMDLTPSAIYIRNLMREVEFWLPLRYLLVGIITAISGEFYYLVGFAWVLIVMLVPFLDKKGRRLGDLIAGTIVITVPQFKLQEDLAMAQKPKQQEVLPEAEPLQQGKFHFAPEMLEIYGKEELQTLEHILRAEKELDIVEQKKVSAKVVQKIAKKIQYPEQISEKDHLTFLTEFYQAQRAVLEKKLVRGQSLERRTRKWFYGKR